MALGDIPSYSHQAIPYYSQVSCSASLHCVPSFYFSFSSISPPLLAHLSPTWGLRVSGIMSGELAMPCLCMALGGGHLRLGLSTRVIRCWSLAWWYDSILIWIF